MSKQYANSLFDVMTAIDTNNLGYYDSLPESKKKELEKNLWLMMKYCSAVDKPTQAESYLILTHKIVNVNFGKMQDHPGLIWKLMAMCGGGNKQYHYLPDVAKRGKKDRRHEVLMDIFPEYRQDEIELIINTTDRETLIEWCLEYGHENADQIF